jgi:hypothetical protein
MQIDEQLLERFVQSRSKVAVAASYRYQVRRSRADQVSTDGITNDMHPSIAFAGFEIWSGGNGLNLKQFCAQAN